MILARRPSHPGMRWSRAFLSDLATDGRSSVSTTSGPRHYASTNSTGTGLYSSRSLKGWDRSPYSVTNTSAPRVTYELTTLGRDLLKIVQALAHWTDVNADVIVQARHEYDQREATV
ncbi:MAG: transcriptional regulator [Hyphomicrobiales bacterium]|nr:MAG: transcriptional regulator [Hyphomicrobiales bacterium]